MTDQDREILEFAGRWWRNSGAAESAIRNELGLSPVRYYQLLNKLLDSQAALAAQPQLVMRLRRIRASRSN